MQEPTVDQLIENQAEIKREALAAEKRGDRARVAELFAQFSKIGAQIQMAQMTGDPRIRPIVRTESDKLIIRSRLTVALRKITPYQLRADGDPVNAFDARGEFGPTYKPSELARHRSRPGVKPDAVPPRPYVRLGCIRDRQGYLREFTVSMSEHAHTNQHEAAEQMRLSTRLLCLDAAEIDAVMAKVEVSPPAVGGVQ